MAQISYVRIENDEVLNRHTFDDSDALKISKLAAHDYKEEENNPPTHDSDYESLAVANPEWLEVAGKWQRQWVKSETLTLNQIKKAVGRAIKKALIQLGTEAKQNIDELTGIDVSGSDQENIDAFNAYISDLRAAWKTATTGLKDRITNAPDYATVVSIASSYTGDLPDMPEIV